MAKPIPGTHFKNHDLTLLHEDPNKGIFMFECTQCDSVFHGFITSQVNMGDASIVNGKVMIDSPCPNSPNTIKEKELTKV